MKYRLLPTLLILSFLIHIKVAAQEVYYQRDTSIKVFAYGQQQTLAWCGGFNNPQFSMGDLNHDGLPDLVVFEPSKGVSTFINTGTSGSPDYRYAPAYALNFPPVSQYLILADYNCDNIPDLFQQGQTGFAVYKGYYNAANQLCFTFYKNLFYYDSLRSFMSNAYNSPQNVPAIVDIDNDGDLDLLSYSILGGNINLYKNMRVEMGLPCDSIVISNSSLCWGKASGGYGNSFNFNTCGGGRNARSLCLLDYDADGDYDLLGGSLANNKMDLVLNGRIPNRPSGPDSMISQDTAWQFVATMLNLPTWPSAFNVDIDQDGKKDLLIAPNAAGENYNCIWYYKNMGTPGSPNWQFESDSFLVDKSIDLGTAANSMLFDYNKDGKPDLFIGSDGYYQADGTLRSRVSYYLNTSTPGNPSFTLQTKDFLGLNTYDFKGAAVAAGDIDNDGIADLVTGHTDGTLSYFKNMATSDDVTPNWVLTQRYLTDIAGDTINVGGNAAPFIYDIDRDGKPDLIIGDISGYIQYYRNISTTPGSMRLQLINTHLGNARVDPATSYGNSSTPFFGKIDNSGIDYLLMGSNSGNIYRFTGFQLGDTTAIYTMLDSQYSYIDSTSNSYSAVAAGGVYGNLRTTVAVSNITADTNYYMITGNIKGGVELYKRAAAPQPLISLVNNVKEKSNVLVYPNPADVQLVIEHANKGALSQIYNELGELIYCGYINSDKETINVSDFIPGIYILQLTDNDGHRIAKTILKQ